MALMAFPLFGCGQHFCEMRHSAELSVVGCAAAFRTTSEFSSSSKSPSSPRDAPVNIDGSICELIGKHERGGDVGGGGGALLDDTVQESDDHDLTRLTNERDGAAAAYPANLRYGAIGSQAGSRASRRAPSCSCPSLALSLSPPSDRLSFSPQREPQSFAAVESGSHDSIAFHKNGEGEEGRPDLEIELAE